MTLKKSYLLPNLFTTGNMFCGFYSIISALSGNFSTAAWSLIVAMFFDAMDGRVARLTKSTSSFGMEYDSLADLLSFGVAPALISYLWCLKPYGRLGWLAAFIYLVCAALRLARFNTNIQVVPKKYFQGMPSPLAAALIATGVLFFSNVTIPNLPQEIFTLSLLLLAGSLMVSTLRFPSFKEFKVKKENSFGVLAVGVLVFILIASHPETVLFVIASSYTLVGIFMNLYRVLLNKQTNSLVIDENVK